MVGMGEYKTEVLPQKPFNPLCPDSVQNQFSPNDNHRLSGAKSTRINKMILKRKIFDLLSNSLSSFFKEMYGGQFGEFVSGFNVT